MTPLANAIDRVGRYARDVLDASDDEEQLVAMRELLDSIMELAILTVDATDAEQDAVKPVLAAAERLTAKARVMLMH